MIDVSKPRRIEDLKRQEIRELQRLLNNCGYGLAVDGLIGPLTVAAFDSFKRGHHLTEPGWIGETTLKFLRRYDSDLSPAIELIKRFEGCKLYAYPCPAGKWTIGYGTTVYDDGTPVTSGDRISNAIAESLLQKYVTSRIVPKLSLIPYWREMSNSQKCALISFAYNVGEDFYGATGYRTITARLSKKEWHLIPQAFLLYVNPGSSFEKGLRRRRQAEGLLWKTG